MKYNLREMTISDIEDVVAGEIKAFGHSLGYEMIYTDLKLNPYAVYMVLEIDNRINGYVGMWVTDHVEIINLYVDEKYQGCGFGSLMMDFVINVCLECQVSSLSLEVRASNQKALKLYQKFGLKEANIRKNYYDNGEDALVMVRQFEVQK